MPCYFTSVYFALDVEYPSMQLTEISTLWRHFLNYFREMDIVDENVEARNDNIDNPNRDNANDDNFEAPDDNEIVNLGPEIEEAIINNEDNEVIRDPNFTIGEEIASFENDNLKLSYRRVNFKKYEQFKD